MTGPDHQAGLATPSLRRRLTLVVLGVVTLMLLALGVTTDLVLQNRLDEQLRQRLVDRAGIASALVDRVDGRDLARRLEGDGVSAVLTDPDGNVYAEGPLAGGAVQDQTQDGTQDATSSTAPEPAATPSKPGRKGAAPTPPDPADGPAAKKATVVQQGDLLSVTRTLSDGSRVVLVADARDVNATLDQVRLALVLAALLVLLVAAMAVPAVVGRAVRPLRTITDVARSITSGDRNRRLAPTDARTDLGATASAFDEMLDEIVGAEQRAIASEARVRTFLGDAAHDLRTPLTGVLAAAEHVLREDPPRAEREETLLAAIREARRAARLVDDMLLMASIDQGLQLTPGPLDLAEVARAVGEADGLAHPGTTVTVDGEPAPVVGEVDRLHRLVANLVQNSAQAGAHEVRLTTRVQPAPEGGPVSVVLDVVDDGPGVPAQERDRVFDRLVRLDAARTGRDSGSGLGLSIARGIARAHGGDLECLAPPGGGALFRLTLPARLR